MEMRDISRRSASCRSDPTTIFLWSEDPYRDNSPPRGSSPPRFPRGHHIARRITSSRTFGRATFAAMSFCTAKIPARNSEVANKFAAGFSSKRWSTAAFFGAAFPATKAPPRDFPLGHKRHSVCCRNQALRCFKARRDYPTTHASFPLQHDPPEVWRSAISHPSILYSSEV